MLGGFRLLPGPGWSWSKWELGAALQQYELAGASERQCSWSAEPAIVEMQHAAYRSHAAAGQA